MPLRKTTNDEEVVSSMVLLVLGLVVLTFPRVARTISLNSCYVVISYLSFALNS